MNWFERNVHWLLLTLFVVTTLATVGFLGVSTLALFAGVLGGASLGALVADAATVLGIATVLVGADVALAVAFVVTVVRRASFPTSDRLAALFALLEGVVPPLRELGLSRRFEPSVEDREREIKRRYVEGELTEAEFEREMRDLLDETESSSAVDIYDSTRDRIAESPSVDDASSDSGRAVERE